MAKVTGPFQITGSLGDLNFYQDKGKNIVRKKGGGFNSKAIKTKASMAPVRENASEFGHCSQVKRVFLQALRPFLGKVKGRTLHSSMTSMFVEIKNCDPESKRGERKVSHGLTTVEGHNKLLTYSYPERYTLDQVLGCKFEVDWNSGTCNNLYFDTTGVSFPKYATHVGLQFGVVLMDFDQLDTQTLLAEEQFIPKQGGQLSISLGPVSLPDSAGMRIAIMGVRFYQEINGVYSPLELKHGVCVLKLHTV